MSCREEAILEAYLSGEMEELPPEVWAHVAACPSCRGLLQVHLDLLEAARTPIVPDALQEEARMLETLRRRRLLRRAGQTLAAGLAVAALLVFSLLAGRTRIPTRTPLTATTAGSQVFVFPEDGTVLKNGRLTLIVKSAFPGAQLLEAEVDGQAVEAWMERLDDAWVLEDFYLPEEGPHDIRITLQAGRDTLEIQRIVFTGGFEL